jgi:hypothetical protein
MITVLVLALALLFPSFLRAAQIDPAPIDKEVVTIPSKQYPLGTTVNPSFTVPATNTGLYEIRIVCDPDAHVVVRLEDEAGTAMGDLLAPRGRAK